ncbi:hypothetical protein SDC9_74285 [bioreactor metagenome]|uniref:Uncharacterized protein n=1 Tax=bioreactor metagenome TaxID=1076179 RepID=A0A644YIQ6_9ZZZZ
MSGNFVVRNTQHVAAVQRALCQEKFRKALVKALPHNLLHQPHHLGKPGGHQLIGVIRHSKRTVGKPFVYVRGNYPQLRVLLRLHGNVKLNVLHNAGGGKQAHVPLEQAVDGDLLPLVGENERT